MDINKDIWSTSVTKFKIAETILGCHGQEAPHTQPRLSPDLDSIFTITALHNKLSG